VSGAGGAALGQFFAGDEHPKGMPAHSLTFLLCEIEHPDSLSTC
jgi:hypothetical protein